MTPLRELLTRPLPKDRPVSLRGETWSDFERDIRRLRARLDRAAEVGRDPHASGFVLSSDDTYAFAVGLFGLWHAGLHAVLPPNRQDRTLTELETRTVGILTDHAPWNARPTALHPLGRDENEGVGEALSSLADDARAVELFTSGTTGDNRSVGKSIQHLDREVAELEQLFGAQTTSGDSPAAEIPAGAAFISTASPAHLYGLLFGVLWPLASGRPFCPEALRQPSEVVPRLIESKPAVLVSVPTTLRQIARHVESAPLADSCAAVFSSGGPLALDTAHALERLTGDAPLEVFGSTETGGVAWRRQRADDSDPGWTPFPSILVRTLPDGRLHVTSPFVSAIDPERDEADASPSLPTGDAGYTMGDRVRIDASGRFQLGGRVDEVVKVAEKRVDLAQMKQVIRAHPGVEDVALAPIERDGRTRIAAVVVPSSEGQAILEERGASELQRLLRAELHARFDPVVHPRLWRIVEALPLDERGKLPVRAIRRLFQGRSPASDRNRISDRPGINEERRGTDFVERHCHVPADLECFSGHFPGLPVVPGVLLLDWALDAATHLLGETARVVRIDSLKLASPLRPGDEFQIIVRTPRPDQLTVEVTSENGRHARGRIRIVVDD